MSVLELYLLTRLDILGSVFFGFGLSCGVVSLLTGLLWLMTLENCNDKERAAASKVLKSALPATVLLFLTFAMLPNNNQLAVIFAGHWATHSEQAKQVPDKAIEVINKFMDEYLEKDKK